MWPHAPILAGCIDRKVFDGRTEGDSQRHATGTARRGALTIRFDVWQLRQDCVGRFRRFPAPRSVGKGIETRRTDSRR